MTKSSRPTAAICALLASAWLVGCGDMAGEPGELDDDLERHYAREVVEFAPGDSAGHGQQHFPEVVLGPPAGAETSAAASDADEVLSLGAGGEIVVGFDGATIVDGPGADFVVFENAFWVQDDPTNVWAELGEVAVSEDGEEWHAFDCDTEEAEPGRWPGCAGWTPTEEYDPAQILPVEPAVAGGDVFDLADIGVERAKYVRIRDLTGEGDPNYDNVGFDLDAVGVVHVE